MRLATTFPPEPTSAGGARRFVVAALDELGRADLVDEAVLLVSEVVTNALLYAGSDIDVVCSRSGEAVRIEVGDRSDTVPGVRHFEEGSTTGRGLGLVEQLASAWGVRLPEDGGKFVWFELGAPAAHEGGAPVGAGGPGIDVVLLDAPVALTRATVEEGDALMRELVLLSLDGAPPGRGDVLGAMPHLDLSELLGALDVAWRAGRSSLDLALTFPPDAGEAVVKRLALVDEAESLAEDGLLLAPPSPPELVSCRHWLLGEIAAQAAGRSPTRWSPDAPDDGSPSAGAVLSDAERVRFDHPAAGVVVADDRSRIAFVNAAAGELLGWDPAELEGRRLTTLVPRSHREAHLAGFARYRLTGDDRILGRRLLLPAITQEGSAVEVGIVIEDAGLVGSRRVFRASLTGAA